MPTVISAEEILDEVRAIVRTAFHGKRLTPTWIMAHQVQARLPKATYNRLIADHGEPGEGSGNSHASSHVVKDALLMLNKSGEVVIDYLDANHEILVIQPVGQVKPGDPTVAIYRYIG